MKFLLISLLCLAAFANAYPPKRGGGKGKGKDKEPALVNKLKDLCMLLLEEAIDDPTKRSWEDVFGAMAPVCEEFLNFKPDGSGSGDRRPPKGDGSGDRPPKGDGSGDRPPKGDGSGDRPPKGDGSGDDGMPPMEERRLGKGGSKGGDRRPPKGDGSGDRPPKGGDRDGSGSGDGNENEHLFWGLFKVCKTLGELVEISSEDKRSWEGIFMDLFSICEDAKEQMESDAAEKSESADLEERRMRGGKGGPKGGSGDRPDGSGGRPSGDGGRRGPDSKDSDDSDDSDDSGSEESGSGSGDDPIFQKGTEVVMHLIRLCEDLAALAEDSPSKRGWEDIFMAVGEVCLATEAQINADMSEGSGLAERTAMELYRSVKQLGPRSAPTKVGKGMIKRKGPGDVAAIFIGLHKMCKSLGELAELATNDKRSWEDIFMSLFEICEDAKEQAMLDMSTGGMMSKRRMGGRKGGKEGGRNGPKGGDKDEDGSGKERPPKDGSGSGRPPKDGSGDGEKDDAVMNKGTEVVIHLIKLCEELKAVAESEADKRSWVEIFTDVGDVCVDTLAQIEADKAGSGSGEPEKRRGPDMGEFRYRGGKSGGRGKGGSKKGPKPEESSEESSEDDDSKGSGSGDKPDVPGKAKLLLDVCEILHVLEIEEEMKAPEEKRDLKAIAESMKVVCEMAYDELEADDE